MINAYEITLLSVNNQGQRQVQILKKHHFESDRQMADYARENGFGRMLKPNQALISESELSGFFVLNPEKIIEAFETFKEM